MTSALAFHAFSDELQKIAATRAIIEARKSMTSGDNARAERMARAGVRHRKTNPIGYKIMPLGAGGEGSATAVAVPRSKRPIQTRFAFDPQGISSGEMIARKAEVGKKLNDPSIAKFLGEHKTPRGGGTVHMSEYVPGPNAYHAAPADFEKTRAAATKAIQATGYNNPADLRPANAIKDARTGKAKFVDFMPAQANEVSFAQGSNKITVSPNGEKLINPNARDFEVPNKLQTQQANHMDQKFFGDGSGKPVPAVTKHQAMLANPPVRPATAAGPKATVVNAVNKRPVSAAVPRSRSMATKVIKSVDRAAL